MKVDSISRSTSGEVVMSRSASTVWPVDIVGSGHRVYSFARVTLDGLSKNHAMTFIHPATTRRYRSSGPTRTPLCWTQPVAVLPRAGDPPAHTTPNNPRHPATVTSCAQGLWDICAL